MATMLRASIVGATGFTGAVLTDLLSRHPQVELGALTSTSYVGRRVAEVFRHLRMEGAYTLYDPAAAADADVAFVCYPHAQSHPVVAELVDAGVRVVDLSADFRLNDPAAVPGLVRVRASPAGSRGRGRVRPARGLSA